MQDFEVTYDFNQSLIVLEPLYLVAFFGALLYATIFLNRLDFSLGAPVADKVKQH
jgi:hypothetical protein